MVTEYRRDIVDEDRMPNRTRHSSVIRRRKTNRRNNGLMLRRSMSCDELVMYRNRTVSPKNIRPKNTSNCRHSQKEKKKSVKTSSSSNTRQMDTRTIPTFTKNKTANENCMCTTERRFKSNENRRSCVLTIEMVNFPTNSLLHYAVSEGDIELVRRLISDDSNDIDKLSIEGTAPIHEASINGDLLCIELLLKYGASLETVDRCNRTAVEYAVLAGHFDCAALLLSFGASDEKIRNGMPYS
eukprot:gene16172-17795_t